jgi:hypothetical protein
MRIVAGLALVFVLAIPPAMAAPLWSGETAGFRVEWTTEDISATRSDGSSAFSARDFAARGFALARADLARQPVATVTMTRRIAVVSLAGPLLALRDEATLEYRPSAHPGSETRLWTIDLRRRGAMGFDRREPFRVAPRGPHRLVGLSELFTRTDLHDALARDPFVRRAVGAPTTSLDELLGLLADRAGSVPGSCGSIPGDLLTRFAVTGVEPTTVRVRIEPFGSQPCPSPVAFDLHLRYRGGITQAIRPGPHDLRLPPPDLAPVAMSFRAETPVRSR